MPVISEISGECQRPNPEESARPLPLAAHWNTGTVAASFDPAYQLAQIQAGHHLLPWFQFPVPELATSDATALAYYQEPFATCQAMGLPLSIVGTQWEERLYEEPFLSLPPADNPNVVLIGDIIRAQLSPFGPSAAWEEVGRLWTQGAFFQQLTGWYRNPPAVTLLSNNEANRLQWADAEDDIRYVALYGTGQTDEEKRTVVGENWIRCYRALQAGMRAGMPGPWQIATRFCAYNAFGPEFLGRYGGWNDEKLAISGRIDPNPLMWDGGSPTYYTAGVSGTPTYRISDFMVYSPQLEAMNWVFMQREALLLNPRFSFELSVWDGSSPGQPEDQRAYYTGLGQTFTPARYGGFVQWGLWLLRPRVVREFRFATETLAGAEAYFLPIVAAVDRVHDQPELARFWRYGNLVANPAHLHPYQTSLTTEQSVASRWFGLDVSTDPARPWALDTLLPVRALALVLGQPPARQWLIYAVASPTAQTGITVTVPGQAPVTLDAPLAGAFYRLDEATAHLTALGG